MTLVGDRSALLRDARPAAAARPRVRRRSTGRRATRARSSTSGSSRCTFAGEDPIGRRITLTDGRPAAAGAPAPPIGDHRRHRADRAAAQFQERSTRSGRVHPAARAGAAAFAMLLMRAHARRSAQPDAARARGSARASIPTCRCSASGRWISSWRRQRWPFRVFGTMFAIFALIALVLSAVGLSNLCIYSFSSCCSRCCSGICSFAARGTSLRTAILFRHPPFWIVLVLAAGWAWSHPRYTALAQFSFTRAPLLGQCAERVCAPPPMRCPCSSVHETNFDHDLRSSIHCSNGRSARSLLLSGTVAAGLLSWRRRPAGRVRPWLAFHSNPAGQSNPRNDLLSERNCRLPSIGLYAGNRCPSLAFQAMAHDDSSATQAN